MPEVGIESEVFLRAVGSIMLFALGFSLLFSLFTFHSNIKTRVVNRMEMNLGEVLLRNENLMVVEDGEVRTGIVNKTKLENICDATHELDKLGISFTTRDWGIFVEGGKYQCTIGHFYEEKSMRYPVFLKNSEKTLPGSMKVYVAKRD